MHGVALKYFLEVAHSGSLSEASRRLHVAVSAISRQIARLEEEVGAALFERAPRGMVLSPAGELMLAHVRRTLLDADAVRTQIAALQETPRDRIRIAASEGPAQGFLPEAMAAFHSRHPQTHYTLHVMPPREAVRRTVEGEVDLALCFTVEKPEGVAVRHAQRAPVCVVMSASHPLARRRRVALDDLRPYPLALTDARSTARYLLERGGALDALDMDRVLESTYSEALLGFVRHSMAITFAGYASVAWRLKRDGMVALPIADADLQARHLQLLTMAGRELPPAIERFVAFLQGRLDAMSASLPG